MGRENTKDIEIRLVRPPSSAPAISTLTGLEYNVDLLIGHEIVLIMFIDQSGIVRLQLKAIQSTVQS